MSAKGTLVSVLQTRRQAILAKWTEPLEHVSASAKGRLSTKDLGKQADEFLSILATTAQTQELDWGYRWRRNLPNYWAAM